MGLEAVRGAVASVSLLVLASDADARREEMMASIARLDGRVRIFDGSWDAQDPAAEAGWSFGNKGALGRMFGRDEVVALGVLDRGLADHVAHAMDVASEMTAQRPEAR